jgi:DNA polymerase-4
VVVVPPEAITSFLHPMEVGELWGVGEKTRDLLLRFGLVTVGDVAHTPARHLQRAVGAALGSHLTSWPGAPTVASSPRAAPPTTREVHGRQRDLRP